ncbi:response regulator, partial [Magnetococcales bacterium HHB-1]
RMDAKAAGATGWLVKPIKPPELLDVVKQVLPGT